MEQKGYSNSNLCVGDDLDKYKEIFEILEKLFFRHNLGLHEKFDEKVWFIQNALKKNSSTPDGPIDFTSSLEHSLLKEIIFSCSDLNNQHNQNNQKLKVSVNINTFINKLCEILINSTNIVERSKSTIKMYNAHQKVNMIDENLKILKSKIEKSNLDKSKLLSTFSLGLKRLEGFPCGDYLFELKVSEISDANNSVKYNSFGSQIDNLIKVNSDKEVEYLNVGKNKFENFNFKALEEKCNEINKSGTSFSSFHIIIKEINKKDIFETKKEEFFNLVLIYIEDIYDLSKESITKSLTLKLAEDKEVIVEMSLNLDFITRSVLLNKVKEIFKGVIDTQRANEDIVDGLLDDYFPEVSEQIKNILIKHKEIERDACCRCNIF